MRDQLLREATLYMLDFETTGSVAGYSVEPWQLGLVRFERGQVDMNDSFESLLRVGDRPVNPYIPGSYHAHEKELLHAPVLLDLWPSIKHALIDYPLGAHNVGTEKKMLRQTAVLHRFGPWIDTLSLARMAWPGMASYALDDLCNELQLTPVVQRYCPDAEPHNALYDAVACGVVLEALLSQDGWRDLDIQTAVEWSRGKRI